MFVKTPIALIAVLSIYLGQLAGAWAAYYGRAQAWRRCGFSMAKSIPCNSLGIWFLIVINKKNSILSNDYIKLDKVVTILPLFIAQIMNFPNGLINFYLLLASSFAKYKLFPMLFSHILKLKAHKVIPDDLCMITNTSKLFIITGKQKEIKSARILRVSSNVTWSWSVNHSNGTITTEYRRLQNLNHVSITMLLVH